jgi:rare lipoprotein A
MTAINLASPRFVGRYFVGGNERVALAAADSVRAALPLACGWLVSSLLAVACAPGLQAAQTTRASSAKTAAQSGAVGGQQYYDVLGKRYNIRASSDGYRERGIASWYGHPFDGRPTSSGEMYDMNELTAAHPTLPIPTWVEVTNLKNGRQVIVKVNDRGPFVGKRLIDLSYAAATSLDMVKEGTARVEVRALPGPPAEKPTPPRDDRNHASTQARVQDKDAKRPVPPAPTPMSRPDSTQHAAVRQSPPLDPNRLFAEAGRFTKRDDAVQLVNTLKSEGFMNAFVVTEDGRRKSFHHVRVGPLADADEVEKMNERLRGLGARRSHTVAMH